MAEYEHLPIYKKAMDSAVTHCQQLSFNLENITMPNLYLILALAVSLPFATAQAAPADVPETGQTLCYNAAGATITCTGTGQDGELRAGVTWPAPRFVVGTGATLDCVTDNLTGLMWVKAPSTTAVIWTTALTSANALTLCGFSDWRLPNRKELRSLINYSLADNAATLNTLGFSNVQVADYWSSSSYAGSAASAWVVDVEDGSVLARDKSLSANVWPVRAGQ